jgi:RimJ/RimL family protein N-acetyltransferase
MHDVIAIASPLGRLELRPEQETDAAFRFALFCDSQSAGWDALPLTPQMRQQLMRHQFEAQILGYRSAFPDARFDIVMRDGEPIGRIIVDRPGTHLHIVDQAIVPRWRGQGIGSSIMRALMHEAADAAIPLRLKVVPTNAAALRLYRRLGFRPIAEPAPFLELEWVAPA